MYAPPVFRTTGIEPYLIAMSWVSPHGSKIEGTRMKSAPAYIYHKPKWVSNSQGHTADVRGEHASRKKRRYWRLSSARTYQVWERLIIRQTKASTVTMSRMQLIGQIDKVILNTRIWGWTKQYNLHLDVSSVETRNYIKKKTSKRRNYDTLFDS